MDPNLPLSDYIEHKYGSLLLDVLSQDETGRIITLKTTQNQVLEHSVVTFADSGVTAYPELHAKILAGALIGKTFAAAGVPYYRDVESMRTISLSQELQALFSVKASTGTQMNVRILVGPNRLLYATIVETYSPHVEFS